MVNRLNRCRSTGVLRGLGTLCGILAIAAAGHAQTETAFGPYRPYVPPAEPAAAAPRTHTTARQTVTALGPYRPYSPAGHSSSAAPVASTVPVASTLPVASTVPVASTAHLSSAAVQASTAGQSSSPDQSPDAIDRRPLPNLAGTYTLQTGDTVDVTFRFTPEFNDEVVVQPDGRAVLKSIGEVRLAGYTLAEIQREVVIGSQAKLVNPEVTVSLKDFERPHIVVAGEVQAPGRFELRHSITALQAVMLAGGPKEDSAMGRVVLFRRLNADTAEVHILKLSRYGARTRAKNDMLLQPDDMLLVQRDNLEKISRYVKLVNLGVYFNALGANNGIF